MFREIPEYSRFSRFVVAQQKVNVIMNFIKDHDDPVYPDNSLFYTNI